MYNLILFVCLSTDTYNTFQAFLRKNPHFPICTYREIHTERKYIGIGKCTQTFFSKQQPRLLEAFQIQLDALCIAQLPRPICTSFCHTAILKVHVLKFKLGCLQNSSKTVPLWKYWFAEHLLLSIVNTEPFVSSESHGISLCYNHAPMNQRKYVKAIQPLLIFYLGTLSFSDHIFISINFGLIFNSLFSVMLSTK